MNAQEKVNNVLKPVTEDVQVKAKEILTSMNGPGKRIEVRPTDQKAVEVKPEEKKDTSEPADKMTKEEVKQVEKENVEPTQLAEGEELTPEEIFEVVGAGNIETAVRSQLGKVELDVEVPDGVPKITRLRDNARQAYKENETRFKNTLEEMESLRLRREKNPNDKSLQDYQVEVDISAAKYISKMRKYLKRYDAAKDALTKAKQVQTKAAEKDDTKEKN